MTKRKSNTLEYLPDNRTELQKLTEHLTTGGSVDGLPEKWVEMWERIKAADSIMRSFVSPKMQREKIAEHELFQGMSRAQLWRYQDAVQEIHAFTEKMNKAYLRLIHTENIQKGLKLAKKWKNDKLYAAMMKEYRETWDLGNFDDESNRPIEPQANVLVIVNTGGDATHDAQYDLTKPHTIPLEIRHRVLSTVYHSQTPENTSFLDAAQR